MDIEEMFWILLGSFILLLYWSFPLGVRLIFAIPGIYWIHAFVKTDGIKLTTKRLLYAGIIAIIFIFSFGGVG